MAQGRSRNPALGQMSNFLKALFICNNTNLNKSKQIFPYIVKLSLFQTLFLFFQVFARSSLKKFENGASQGTYDANY